MPRRLIEIEKLFSSRGAQGGDGPMSARRRVAYRAAACTTVTLAACALTTLVGQRLGSVKEEFLICSVALAALIGGRLGGVSVTVVTSLWLGVLLSVPAFGITGAAPAQGLEVFIYAPLALSLVWIVHQWRSAMLELDDRVRELDADAERRKSFETRLQALNLELSRSNAHLESAVQGRDRFLAQMSHEIRTPLNGMLGMLRVLDGTQLAIRQREYLRGAVRSGTTLMHLLNELIEVGLDAKERTERTGEPFDLFTMVEDLVLSFRSLTDEKGLTLTREYTEQTPRFLIGNELAVRQVLNNLTHNAIKFTGTGGIVIGIDGDFHVGSRVDLRIRVADTGRGMEESAVAALFASPSQRSAEERRQHGGAGIGLGIVAALVEGMQGQIAVTSVPGEGTEFVLSMSLDVDATPRTYGTVGSNTSVPGVILLGGGITESRAVTEMLRRSRVWVDQCDSVVRCVSLFEEALSRQPYSAVVLMPDSEALDDSVRRLFIASGVAVVEHDRPAADGNDSAAGVSAAHDDTSSIEHFVRRILQQLEARADTMHAEHAHGDSRPDVVPDGSSGTAAAGVPSRAASGGVLLVDDESMNLLVLRELLRMEGISVETVSNGADAVARIAQGSFAAVFMDIRMPGMSGVQATAVIREREQRLGLPPTPIIATTANNSATDRELYEAGGLSDVLTKPIESAELTRVLSRWVDAANARERMAGSSLGAEERELVDLFLGNGAERLEELRAALEREDADAESLAAHTLKSMARHMGYTELGEVCQSLEHETGRGAKMATIDHSLIVWAEGLFDEARRELEESRGIVDSHSLIRTSL